MTILVFVFFASHLSAVLFTILSRCHYSLLKLQASCIGEAAIPGNHVIH